MELSRCLAKALDCVLEVTTSGRLGLGCLAALSLSACGPSLAQNVTDVGLTCEQRQERLQTVLSQMPSEALVSPVAAQLPRLTLPTGLIRAPLLELTDAEARFEGTPLAGANSAQWARDFSARWANTHAGAADRPLLIAAEWNVDVTSLHWFLQSVPESTRVHLLFARPAPQESMVEPERYPLAQRVLLEPDAQQRVALAERAYDEYSTCRAVDEAVQTVSSLTGVQRWPSLKAQMLRAIPQCDCAQLDAEGLRHLLSAEQRAGSLSLGSIDVSFMRDVRCRASMPLLPVQEVLREIDGFDAEFSAQWEAEAIHFQDEISAERLKNYLCVASPGETLALLQRDAATVHWKVGEECQAWRFLPLQRGAPMGTLQRVDPGNPSSIHYWQAVEDIRLYGPAVAAGLPTDAGPWQCSEEFRLQRVEQDWIELDNGVRWYFEASQCQRAPTTHPAGGKCALRDFAGFEAPVSRASAPAYDDAPASDAKGPASDAKGPASAAPASDAQGPASPAPAKGPASAAPASDAQRPASAAPASDANARSGAAIQ